MSEVFDVFYAWQSDTPRSHCHDLVRDALDLAAESIGRDAASSYKVSVQSDTENEAGMCNIPETILRRLRESDAVVFDLTFVATTGKTLPKHCSNPNVLFELGYAFGQIGPKRLICVMNEQHGPASSQIFDLAHHRRPIAFRSPVAGKKRNDTVRGLAKSLEAAIREVMKLGRAGSSGGDNEALHQRQLSEIKGYREASRLRKHDPYLALTFRPSIFRQKRWADVEQLEAVLREKGPLTDRIHRYPPQVKGNAPMDWGLYNDIYGDPWAFTYAGQFWTESSVGGHQRLQLLERDAQLSPEPPQNRLLEPEQWIDAERVLSTLRLVLRLAANLAATYSEHERMIVEIEAVNIRDRWLKVHDGWCAGPNKAPLLRRRPEMSARELRDGWGNVFVEIGKDFCDLFCRDGRTLSREDISEFSSGAIS